MKTFKSLLTVSFILFGFILTSYAQSDMQKLSATKPASLTSSASSTDVQVKKEAEKYFNISMLDALRSNTNHALMQWQQAARGNSETLHNTYVKEKQLYLNELNKTLSSSKDKETIKKADAEINRLTETK